MEKKLIENNQKEENEYNLIELKEPLQNESELSEEKLKEEKVTFISRLFFLWTLIIMKLSNKKKLKKETIRNSPLFINENKNKEFNSDFIFLKEIWEGKNNKGGYNKFTYFSLILTILRFNFFGLLFLLFLLFLVQLSKMIILYYKRNIINLFFLREQNLIIDYTNNKFRILLSKNILCFLIIDLVRFLINHQLKYLQRKLT